MVMKILYVILGILIMPISYIFPRNNRLWVIGSLNGFTCNSKYFFIDFYENHRSESIKLIWLSKNKKSISDLNSIGFKNCYYIWSLKGIYFLLRAGIYITSYPLDESLCFSTLGRAKYINLWHGVGLKYHRFMIKNRKSYYYYHNKITSFLLYPFLFKFHRRFDLFLSTSPLMSNLFIDSFRINRKSCIEGLYPRCSFLLSDAGCQKKIITKYEGKKTIELIDKFTSYDLSYIYMPTWRDNNPNFLDGADFDFSALNEILIKKNEVFLVKLHPRTPRLNLMDEKYSNIIFIDNRMDVYNLLPFIDVLITDYSSVYYDFILMENKNTILFPFDLDDYLKNSRDFALDFDTHTAGEKVYHFNELLDSIKLNKFKFIDKENENRVRGLFWAGDFTPGFLFREIEKNVEIVK